MILYTQTPDYYDEYLQHGWLKDQAAKVHKYIERWRGKNGKWYYRYAVNKAKQLGGKAKLKAIDLKTKFNRTRNFGGSKDTIFYEAREDDIASGKRKSSIGASPARVTYNYGKKQGHVDNGRVSSYTKMEGATGNGIEAGRERVANKKKAQKQKNIQKIYNDQQSNRKRTTDLKSKGYKQGDLSKKGYSDSKSGANNSATNKSLLVRKSNNSKYNLTNNGYADSKKISSGTKKILLAQDQRDIENNKKRKKGKEWEYYYRYGYAPDPTFKSEKEKRRKK